MAALMPLGDWRVSGMGDCWRPLKARWTSRTAVSSDYTPASSSWGRGEGLSMDRGHGGVGGGIGDWQRWAEALQGFRAVAF